MTASTSTTSGPWPSRTVTRSCWASSISRSPSRARQPALGSRGTTWPGRTRRASSTPTSAIRPGASGTVTAWGARSGGARRRWSPKGAARGTGATAAATADRPTTLGLAKVTSASEIDPTRHRARDPTQRSAVTATSTSALSRAPPSTATSSCLARRTSSSPPSRPVATRPVARPATVASRSSGKALLVPVDSAHSGMSPQCLATTRWVPSPPRTTIAATCRSAMASTASAESRASSRSAISSTSSSGRRWAARCPVRPPRWRRRLGVSDHPNRVNRANALPDPPFRRTVHHGVRQTRRPDGEGVLRA
jgi:hypothetical protein